MHEGLGEEDEVRRRLASEGRELYRVKLRERATGAGGETANIPEERPQDSYELVRGFDLDHRVRP